MTDITNLYAENNLLLGAIAGDLIGSYYEFRPTKDLNFPLFHPESRFTDDTVMTMATAQWILTQDNLPSLMQEYGNRYPDAGYGRGFQKWLTSKNPRPYNSFGNGSAMRISPVGWAFPSLEETLQAASENASVSHNHPEGIKGAQATAACIFLARTGHSKEQIKKYIEETFHYDLHQSCGTIRKDYTFDVTCQGSVPPSITAFLESNDYEHAVRLAVSLGGDADTMGAITGSIAEAYYQKIPDCIRQEVMRRLPSEFIELIRRFSHQYFIPSF